MNPISSQHSLFKTKGGFSLIEVVLAIGIFLVTVLALVGLLGPTLRSVDEVEKTDEVSSVVNTLNAFLQNSPEIAVSPDSKFATIYKGLKANGSLSVFVFRAYDSNNDIVLKLGFSDLAVGDTNAAITIADIKNGAEILAAGTVYRAVLSASSVTPVASRSEKRTNGVYTLSKDYDGADPYPEGSLAMEVRIFAEEPGATFVFSKTLADLATAEPIFTYNTAIVR